MKEKIISKKERESTGILHNNNKAFSSFKVFGIVLRKEKDWQHGYYREPYRTNNDHHHHDRLPRPSITYLNYRRALWACGPDLA